MNIKFYYDLLISNEIEPTCLLCTYEYFIILLVHISASQSSASLLYLFEYSSYYIFFMNIQWLPSQKIYIYIYIQWLLPEQSMLLWWSVATSKMKMRWTLYVSEGMSDTWSNQIIPFFILVNSSLEVLHVPSASNCNSIFVQFDRSIPLQHFNMQSFQS